MTDSIVNYRDMGTIPSKRNQISKDVIAYEMLIDKKDKDKIFCCKYDKFIGIIVKLDENDDEYVDNKGKFKIVELDDKRIIKSRIVNDISNKDIIELRFIIERRYLARSEFNQFLLSLQP